MYNYVVTAQKPTSVGHSVTGNFTSPTARNLIVSKNTRLEIHLLTPEGLKPLADVAIYGRIAALQLFRPEGERRDLLFLMTEKFRFCVLEYDEHTREIVTRANGDLQDRVGRQIECGQLVSIDPQNRAIGVQIYDSFLKIIPLERSTLKDAFNLRLEELTVLDLKFLPGCSAPTVALLYQDPKEQRHVKAYEINLKDRELGELVWQHSHLDPTAQLLIPAPPTVGGVLLLSETSVAYHGPAPELVRSMNIRPQLFRAYTVLDRDGLRYLVANHTGQLSVLALVLGDALPQSPLRRVTDLRLEPIGETNLASTLSYLDNRFVFVGSTYGDSQVIRLGPSGSGLDVVEQWTNLGPIVDLCVVDLERQGQGQVVTCSGAYKNGSLRVVRNGIGINEQASIELSGIKGMWSMRDASSPAHDKYLVVSFVRETHVLAIAGEELEEQDHIGGFRADAQTLYCGNVQSSTRRAVQITPGGVRLIDMTTARFDTLAEWQCAGTISHASCHQFQLVLGLAGGELVSLELDGDRLEERARRRLEHDVACVSCAPLRTAPRAAVCAVGLWTDVCVQLLRLPSLEPLHRQPLPANTVPRSVLFASFESGDYLLCGLGDGHLVTFDVAVAADFALSNRKKLSLGTQPIQLVPFAAKNTAHVFAASDRPMVMYARGQKLLYSNVNLKEATHMCPFHAASFPDSLALATENRLVIGTVDEIQKLHIRCVPLNEMPRRIAHQDTSRTFLVLTERVQYDANGEEHETNQLRLLDDQTFEVLATYTLDPHEHGCSVLSAALPDIDAKSEENASAAAPSSAASAVATYFVVGTAYVLPHEPEPVRGRLLLLSVADRKLVVLAEKETRGAVYDLLSLTGRLLAAINSRLQLMHCGRTADGGRELVLDAQLPGHVLALYLAARGDFVLVGDLLKGLSLIGCRTTPDGGCTLEEIARDQPNWMTAVEMLDDDTHLGAENSFNLFTSRRNSDAATDEERARLVTVGEFHLGEFVNRFRHGSLVMRMTEAEANSSSPSSSGSVPRSPGLIFGTVSGMLGVVCPLTAEQYQFFVALQRHLTAVVKGVGGLKHKDWRAFQNERKTVEASNFIDGDLIESFLDLSRDRMQEIAQAMGPDVSVEDICQRIEAITQATH